MTKLLVCWNLSAPVKPGVRRMILAGAMVTHQGDSSLFRYEKVAFVWDEPLPLITVPDRIEFRSVTPDTRQKFISTIEQVLDGSLDRFDQARVARSAARHIAEWYARPNERDFVFELEWWQLAYRPQGEVVGFTQPVVFRGNARGRLKQGTIHYIGVVPRHRGQGYIVDLLSAATRRLQEIGVSRIYCDTDSRNAPMVAAFRRVGYKQGEARIVSYRLNQ
ncbi:MAG: GNAT family N-acetyltransferase [Armatimonadota bacterium]